jgi:hypothetical protein
MTWTAPLPEPVDGPLAQRPVPASSLSLLGLLRHLAKVERIWLRQRAPGLDVPPLYDPALGKDHDFEHLDPADAEHAVATLLEEHWLGDQAVADLDLDHADLLRQSTDGVTGR